MRGRGRRGGWAALLAEPPPVLLLLLLVQGLASGLQVVAAAVPGRVLRHAGGEAVGAGRREPVLQILEPWAAQPRRGGSLPAAGPQLAG